MTESTQEAPPVHRNRYPGPQPFSDSREDQQIFFGRDDDIKRLFERVIGTRLLVLFGKSGLGKTSLLMAGLFPKLRLEKPLLPVPIRVNEPGSPAEIVITAVVEACTKAGVDITQGDDTGIWEFLRTSLIWSGDLLLTPVLVFDQFEEIFTLRDAEFRTSLANELGALASGVPPDRLLLEKKDKAERGARLGEQPPQVKIILSLREEYLGTLQELSVAVPGLFQERYRLSPLSNEEARQAIVKPAGRQVEEQDVPFASPCFGYHQAALDDLLNFLESKSGVIEPFLLQLQCCRAEEIIANRTAGDKAAKWAARPKLPTGEEGDDQPPLIQVTAADLGGFEGMEGVFRQFYDHVLGKLSWMDRRRARGLCEEGLLSATGTRLSLEKAQIKSDYGINGTALETLVNERLLRCEPHLESLLYEISHDRLAESIERSRPFRIPKNFRLMLRGAVLVSVLTIAALVWWNHQITQARKSADSARSDAEQLVSFLIGETLLEKLRPVGRNAILEEVQNEVQAYLAKMPGQHDTDNLRIRGLALRNLGDILVSKGSAEEAVKNFRDSIQIFEKIAQASPSDPEPRVELARSYERLGSVLLEQGNITNSLEAHRKAMMLRQVILDSENRSDARIDLAESLNSVGYTLNQMGRPNQAIKSFEKALDALQPVTENTTPTSARLLKVLHGISDNRAESLDLIGDQQGKLQGYEESLSIVEQWIKHHPLSADARLRLVIAKSRQANELRMSGAARRANELYREINRSVEELVRWDDTNTRWRRNYAATLILLVEGRQAAGQYDQVAKDHNQALDILHDLAEKDPDLNSLKSDLQWGYQSRGRLASDREQWDQAVEDFKMAERYISEALDKDKAYATWQRELVWVNYDLAESLSAGNWTGPALPPLRKGRSIITDLIETAPEMTVLLQDLAAFYRMEIRTLENIGENEEAMKLSLEKEKIIVDALARQPDNPWILNEAHIDDARIGDQAQSAGRSSEALAAYHRGLERIKRATELAPDNTYYWVNLRNIHEDIGNTLKADKRWDEAEAAYRDGIEAGKNAVGIASHRVDYLNQLFLLQIDIGDTLESAGRDKSALAEFELARPWIDKAIGLEEKKALYFDNRRALFARIADVKLKLNDVAGAITAHREAMTAGQRASKLDRNNAKYLAEILEIHNDIGDILKANQRWDEAEAAYRDGIEAGKNAPDIALRSANYLNQLFLLQIDIGDTLESAGRDKSALAEFELARPWIDKAIGLEGKKALYFDNRRALYARIANVKLKLNDVAGAIRAYREAIKAGLRATELDQNNVDYFVNLLKVHNNIGDTLRANERWEEAEAAYREGIKAGQNTDHVGADSADYANQIFLLHIDIGDVLKSAGKHKSALAEFELSRPWIDKAIDLEGQKALYFDNRRALYDRIASVNLELDDITGVIAAYREGIKAGRSAADIASDSADYANQVFLLQHNIADVLESTGKHKLALREFELARPWIDKAIDLEGRDAVYFDNRRALYARIAKLRNNLNDITGAIEAYKEAIKAGLRAIELDPDNTTIHLYLSDSSRQVGILHQNSGMDTQAQQNFELAVEAGQRVTELAPDDGQSWQQLYLAQWFLADHIEIAGNFSDSVRLLEEALKNAEQAARLLPEDSDTAGHVEQLRNWLSQRAP